jgi:hypothetical protein
MADWKLEQLKQLVTAYPEMLPKLTLGVWEQLAEYLWQEMTGGL